MLRVAWLVIWLTRAASAQELGPYQRDAAAIYESFLTRRGIQLTCPARTSGSLPRSLTMPRGWVQADWKYLKPKREPEDDLFGCGFPLAKAVEYLQAEYASNYGVELEFILDANILRVNGPREAVLAFLAENGHSIRPDSVKKTFRIYAPEHPEQFLTAACRLFPHLKLQLSDGMLTARGNPGDVVGLGQTLTLLGYLP